MARECQHSKLCYVEQDVSLMVRNETVALPREPVPVCARCNEQSWPDDDADRLLVRAYAVYRLQHGLLQPEEIRQTRCALGLSPDQIDQEAGFKIGVVAGIERGALQTEEYDAVLRRTLGVYRELAVQAPAVVDELRPTSLGVVGGMVSADLGRESSGIAWWTANTRMIYAH